MVCSISKDCVKNYNMNNNIDQSLFIQYCGHYYFPNIIPKTISDELWDDIKKYFGMTNPCFIKLKFNL